MATAEEFRQQMKALAQEVVDSADEAVRRASIAALEVVVNGTPVDKGQAVSNWIVTKGAPNASVVPPFVPGENGSTADLNRRATIEAGTATLGNVRDGDTVYIQNNLPYIQLLNQGSSTRAPAGFVERAVLAAQAVINNFRALKR